MEQRIIVFVEHLLTILQETNYFIWEKSSIPRAGHGFSQICEE